MAKSKKYGTRYPWVEWFKRPSFVLRRGWHFSCATASMGLMTRTNAKRLGYVVSLETPHDGAIKVTVTGRPAGVK